MAKVENAKTNRVVLGKYEIFHVNDMYLYRLKASNGEILVVSEIYKSEKGAVLAIETVKKSIDNGTILIYKDKHNLWQFKLFAQNKRLLVVSANYTSQQGCEAAANSFKKFAAISPIEVLEEDPEHLIEEIKINNETAKKGGKIITSVTDDIYEFKLVASNGVLLCSSNEYTSRQSMNNGIEAFKGAIKDGRFVVVCDKNKTYQFKLYTSSGRCIVLSEAYKNKSQAVSAANSVASFVFLAEIVDKEAEGKSNVKVDRVLKAAIIGVGSRGGETYGRYFMERPDMFKISALCEIKPDRLKKYQREFMVDESQCFVDENEFFKEKRADFIVISTLDQDHVRHALKAIELNYHILLEKPITANEEELYMLQEAADKKKVKILVCHVLRYTVAMQKIKELLNNKAIGELVSIDHLENVTYWHQAHSFVRGNWRKKEDTAPMILAKCCHDLDLLQWFANSECDSISSFGKLNFFNAKHAPKGAKRRCLDCPHVETCPYSAYNIYIKKWKIDGSPKNCWPYNVLTDETLSEDTLMEAIKKGPYGRCVFYCDNDVVDSQSVNILFKNGVSANLKMTAFSKYSGRYAHFFGTMGDIIYDEPAGTINLNVYNGQDQKWTISELTNELRGHGGGDIHMMNYFYRMIVDNKEIQETSLSCSIQSHLMAFAAEKSRENGGELVKL